MNSNKSDRLSDGDIIELYFERDEGAINATGRKYGAYLFTIGNNILNDRFDSEECLNDTYFTTWNRIPPERPTYLQMFLSKIMRDVSVSRYRKSKAKKRISSELVVSMEELGDTIVSGEADIVEDIAMKETVRVLNSFLGSITKRQRFIFICRYYYCDKVTTIAKMLSVSQKTVYRELEKLRSELKCALKKEGVSI
ncbi:MAG: sigma-70 family RNA polymerase sigma factor [Clostridia bacterium]|nr:sigma-70 family RNA polymerase sigma factor [Clostridia bacterium]